MRVLWTPERIEALLPPVLRERWRGREVERIKWARHCAVVHGTTLEEELARIAASPREPMLRGARLAELFQLADERERRRYGAPGKQFAAALHYWMRRGCTEEEAARRIGRRRLGSTPEQTAALALVDPEVRAKYGLGRTLNRVRQYARYHGLPFEEAARRIRLGQPRRKGARYKEVLALIDPALLVEIACPYDLARRLLEVAERSGRPVEEVARGWRPIRKYHTEEERRLARNARIRERRRANSAAFLERERAYRERIRQAPKPKPAPMPKPKPAPSPSPPPPVVQEPARSRNRHCGTCLHCGIGHCILRPEFSVSDRLICRLYEVDAIDIPRKDS